MGNSKKPRQDDRDETGIADSDQSQASVSAGREPAGDDPSEAEPSVQSNPIIINH